MTLQPGTFVPWRPVAAFEGPGSILIGPHEYGVQALVPPAVLLLTPPDDDETYSEEGWRQAIWNLNHIPVTGLDDLPPSRVETITLSRVVSLSLLAADYHPSWLGQEIKMRIVVLSALLRNADMEAEQLIAYRSEIDDLLLDATRELGEAWVKDVICDEEVIPTDAWLAAC